MLSAIFLWWSIGFSLFFLDILSVRKNGRNKDFYTSDFFAVIMAFAVGACWGLFYYVNVITD